MRQRLNAQGGYSGINVTGESDVFGGGLKFSTPVILGLKIKP